MRFLISVSREWVQIEVTDVNEHAPVFTQSSYIINVPEKQMLSNIVTLEATDQDTSDLFHRICRYYLLTHNVPFVLSEQGRRIALLLWTLNKLSFPPGVLSNTEPLDFSIQHNYILTVQAEDCGGKQSEHAFVNIEVVQTCSAGWKGACVWPTQKAAESEEPPIAFVSPLSHLQPQPLY
jgi:hypothetical protein